MGYEPLSLDAVRRLCVVARRLTNGPLNATYLIERQGRMYFIRERITDDAEYGQTFAGERFVFDYFADPGVVRIPRLQQVVLDEAGVERFAIFDAIDGQNVDWLVPQGVDDLVTTLLAIHTVRGTRLGNIRGPFLSEPVAQSVENMFRSEIARVAAPSPLAGLVDRLSSAASHSDRFTDEAICLCHGDVHARNFMRDREGRFWTVDWEAARFRVAAADMNQLQYRWFSKVASDGIAIQYAARAGRPIAPFLAQIAFLRVLWHVRTYNFETMVRCRPVDDPDLADHVLGVRHQLDRLDWAVSRL